MQQFQVFLVHQYLILPAVIAFPVALLGSENSQNPDAVYCQKELQTILPQGYVPASSSSVHYYFIIPYWEQVFLISAEIHPDCNCFLKGIYHQTHELAKNEEIIQKLLTWVDEKATSLCKNQGVASTILRAFYFSHTLGFDFDLVYILDWQNYHKPRSIIMIGKGHISNYLVKVLFLNKQSNNFTQKENTQLKNEQFNQGNIDGCNEKKTQAWLWAMVTP